ncbi:hypothetical protein SAMN05444412_11311 [Rhodonellum ikkaensis]|uniref:Uncharacterized protein n=1 Tax=Rhodonellum ikkaensis TaxID=336829 RepID=A0A1H3SQ69_9BACT|nr:hypothetical protein SAMN05444412_11311 [Rhodonellum ikkaensis]
MLNRPSLSNNEFFIIKLPSYKSPFAKEYSIINASRVLDSNELSLVPFPRNNEILM